MTEKLAYNPTEAATVASCARRYIDEAISAGRLPAVDISRRRGSERHAWRIRRADLDEWIAAGYPTEPLAVAR